jgi:hypothetical protein
MPFVVISILSGEQCNLFPNEFCAYSEFPSECAAETILNLCIETHNAKAVIHNVEKRFMREEFLILERSSISNTPEKT